MKNIPVFFKVLFFILLTILIAIAVIWPLWKFATSAASIYTVVVLFLLLAFFVYKIISKVLKNGKKSKK